MKIQIEYDTPLTLLLNSSLLPGRLKTAKIVESVNFNEYSNNRLANFKTSPLRRCIALCFSEFKCHLELAVPNHNYGDLLNNFINNHAPQCSNVIRSRGNETTSMGTYRMLPSFKQFHGTFVSSRFCYLSNCFPRIFHLHHLVGPGRPEQER